MGRSHVAPPGHLGRWAPATARAALLVALLTATAASARSRAPAPPPRPPDQAAAEVPASASPADAEDPPDDAEAKVSRAPEGAFDDYQLAQVQRVDVLDGPTRVAVETNGPAPATGGMAMRVFVDNSAGAATTLQLRFNATSAGHRAERAVALAAGERRTVNVPLLAGMHYGVLTAGVPGQPAGSATVFLHPAVASTSVVLCLGAPQAFQRLAGHPPSYEEARVQVLAIPPGEAPEELLAYAGYEAVVLPDPATLGQLEEAPRRALEAYVATGGALVLGGAPATWSALPMLRGAVRGGQPYGFGTVTVLGEGGGDTAGLLRGPVPVTPRATLRERPRRGQLDDALLPQARPPLGSFLGIITLFTLAIGPGSVWVARRFRPATLLLSIPATALLTSVLLVGSSLVADGFTLHGSSHGLTLLDGPRHRAITLGLAAYHANLGPGRASYPALTALVGPEGSGGPGEAADLAWRDGLTLGPDFLPSRTYREWGFLAVEPTRARLVLARRGGGWVVQNALGHRVRWVLVKQGEGLLVAEGVPDGAEQALRPDDGSHRPEAPAEGRFSSPALLALERSLGPGEFLAVLEGAGFVPTGGLRPELAASGHLVRGEVER